VIETVRVNTTKIQEAWNEHFGKKQRRAGLPPRSSKSRQLDEDISIKPFIDGIS
jgi:hypothetical protein